MRLATHAGVFRGRFAQELAVRAPGVYATRDAASLLSSGKKEKLHISFRLRAQEDLVVSVLSSVQRRRFPLVF